MARNEALSPDRESFADNIHLNLFSQDDDEVEELDNLYATNIDLFHDLPSNIDTTRSMHTISRRSVRRRRSNRVESFDANNDPENNDVFHPEELASMLDSQDGAASSQMMKSLAAPMAHRKSVRNIRESRKSIKYSTRQLSCWKGFQLRSAMAWSQFKQGTKESMSGLSLWKSPLKEIEGNFGNGVLSYFVFLKSLLFMNIGIFIIEFCFVVIPQMFINHQHLIPEQDHVTVLKQPSNCTIEDMDFYMNRTVVDHILDFFTGQGYINTTLMFYSNYQGQIVADENDLSYDMPLAYMLVGGSYFLLSLLLMVKSLSRGFTESIIESGGFFYSYCNKVFAGWDYCITSEKSVILKCNCIFKDFEAELSEEKRLEAIKSRTKWDRFYIYSLRLLITLLVMALLGGAIYGIIKSVEVSQDPTLTLADNSLINIMKRWASSLTISVLNVFLPFVFEILTAMEQWSPRVELAMALWRAVLLKLSSVAVLVITLFSSYSNYNCQQQCWENQVAAQMFNLLLIDFFITVAITVVAETGRKYVYRYLTCGCNLGHKIGMQEFQIPKNVLDLVYGQSLIWIGTFFAPLIPVIGILKLVVMFYVKKISLMHNCKPSSTPYQGARSNYLFTLLLLLTYLLCAIAVGWGLTRITTSCCGPFGNIDCNPDKKMLDIITVRIYAWGDWIKEAFEFLKTAVFIFPLLIIVFLMLYYYRAIAKAHEKMIGMLKDQLIMEGRDKRYLMDRLVRTANEINGRQYVK